MKYRTKSDLLARMSSEREALLALVEQVPAARRNERGVWGDGWTLSDLLAHLAEWHALFLGWFRDGQRGVTPDLPAPGYKWSETPRLNRAIWEKHRGRSFAAVAEDFEATHREVYGLLEGLSEPQLLEAGHFSWTGSNSLSTYAGANTVSHYRFAQKVLKRWLRQGASARSKR